MDNNEKIRTWLENDCRGSFSCKIKDNHIYLGYSWGIKGGSVSCIEVYLQGTNPLTGKKLSRTDYIYSFGAAQSSHHQILPLYGEFALHFDAVLHNGVRLNDFTQPYPIRIYNADYEPYIRYSLTNAWGGWKELSIESNCFSQLKGKLWVRCRGHMQKLPNMDSNKIRVCLPVNHDEVQVLCLDSSEKSTLPQPKKM